ncbi:hypothetical protein Acr_26g0002820 [Actinidia rufa]|uniref:Uncharacterized protein n=1 Tax=Actinidia rufa TaxID=165716 RepID=A0A7J0H1U6_9ERIC|nr:hypothetical protein Acr_26g0002820 [Actinidia rufa]
MRRIRSKSLSLRRRLFTDGMKFRLKCGKRTTSLEIEPENRSRFGHRRPLKASPEGLRLKCGKRTISLEIEPENPSRFGHGDLSKPVLKLRLKCGKRTNSLEIEPENPSMFGHRRPLKASPEVNAANSLEESVLAKKIVYRWDEASFEVQPVWRLSRRIGQGSFTGDLSKPVPKLRLKCGKRTTSLEIEPENQSRFGHRRPLKASPEVNAANSLEESVLAKKIVYRWDEGN